jgi:hypothetical protein
LEVAIAADLLEQARVSGVSLAGPGEKPLTQDGITGAFA